MATKFLAAILFTSVLGVSADTHSKSTSSSSSLQDGLSQLEQMYVEDCQDDPSPHGYYGAFFQPCEFSFFKSSATKGSADGCSSESSTLLGTRNPVHWLFELQKHIDRDDWDELSSDDIPDWDDLMLWPDQCVGVTPRCYSIRDMSSDSKNESDLTEVLKSLFPDGIPDEATHVQVDCRSDAMELSRVAFSFASGIEKGLGFVIAMFLLFFLLLIVSMCFCCYGCFRLCSPRSLSRKEAVPIYYAVPAEPEFVNDEVRRSLVKERGLELSTRKHYQAVSV